jgi:hypothetical protein
MKVVIQQVDMDTALTALILGISQNDDVTPIHGEAGKKDLVDSKAVCIEAGGSGNIEHNNFDHHNTEVELPPACVQAFKAKSEPPEFKKLVNYVAAVDINPAGLPKLPEPVFPTLSHVFSGMRLKIKDPKEQFLAGIEIFKKVLDMKLDPFGLMPEIPEWEDYLKIKRKQREDIEKAKKEAEIFFSKNGRKIGYLETNFIGTPGALYELGCQVVIAYNTQFGDSSRAKFTIAGNGVRVNSLLSILDKLEAGWGGHETIIGSPREKETRLKLMQIKKIVKDNL